MSSNPLGLGIPALMNRDRQPPASSNKPTTAPREASRAPRIRFRRSRPAPATPFPLGSAQVAPEHAG